MLRPAKAGRQAAAAQQAGQARRAPPTPSASAAPAWRAGRRRCMCCKGAGGGANSVRWAAAGVGRWSRQPAAGRRSAGSLQAPPLTSCHRCRWCLGSNGLSPAWAARRSGEGAECRARNLCRCHRSRRDAWRATLPTPPRPPHSAPGAPPCSPAAPPQAPLRRAALPAASPLPAPSAACRRAHLAHQPHRQVPHFDERGGHLLLQQPPRPHREHHEGHDCGGAAGRGMEGLAVGSARQCRARAGWRRVGTKGGRRRPLAGIRIPAARPQAPTAPGRPRRLQPSAPTPAAQPAGHSRAASKMPITTFRKR